MFYMDDIVLFAETKKGLERALLAIHQWNKKWKLECNMTKSVVIVFLPNILNSSPQDREYAKKHFRNTFVNNDQCDGTTECNCHFRFGDSYIRRKESQKYLGIIFNQEMLWRYTKEDRLTIARGKVGAIKNMGIINGLNPNIASTLADAYVKSTLLYGAEIWYNPKEEWPEGDIVLKRIGKAILKVNVTYPSEAVWGELGWRTSNGEAALRRLRFIKRLGITTNALTKEIAEISEENSSVIANWYSTTAAFVASLHSTMDYMKIATSVPNAGVFMRRIINMKEETSWKRRIKKKQMSHYGKIHKNLIMQVTCAGNTISLEEHSSQN